MEFKEIFTSPFTTPTTCYSCGGRSNNTTTIDDDDVASPGGNDTTETIQFATENHILGVGITSSTANKNNKNDGVKISCRSVPRDSAHLTCVGYAYWDGEEEEKEQNKMEEEKECIHTDRIESNQLSASSDSTATTTVHHRIEAMTFIDPALIEENQFKCQDLLLSSPNNMNLHRPSGGPVIIDDKDDNISVMSNMNTIEGSTNQPQQQQHRRRQSGISQQQQQQHRRNPSTASLASLPNSGLVGSSYHRNNNNDIIFVDVTSERIIVDGPLSSLKLDKNRYTPLRVTVGSLCGYVCQLTYDSNNNCWEGPFIIVQDLWNPTINTEESVLVVDIWNNYIAIGTQLGRCLLYATHDSENYLPVWQAILPYPIHGITIIKNNNAVSDTEGKCSMNLAVTTRRSFHLFDAIKGGIKWRRKPTRERYSPELARDRLLKILEEIRNENRESDLITQKLVRETIEELIENVEKKFQEEETNVSIVVSDTIANLLNRVEQIAHENNTLMRLDSSNLGQEIAVPDPPHWEYSSSDDEFD
ncbi:hypothetical protein FRACYDRAFT_238113 [Fragilariopsis cylindrus CCMP1102]|uniref:Uncharacterized protein n=1 Tax=Fragilariopsis cylindrus CCMP1102 TaxID=635003 RepID=A0A1E7FHM4_9STRA|nr:hypothetical protein FRACYDRAFT_238113 [Fragilariopsis cylindrus CCMP1102]|eukprot:OEU17686.1 hypothetical protein FRACYDRAFT_238113 [Fragilariopsis cylindrus CCMP1102]